MRFYKVLFSAIMLIMVIISFVTYFSYRQLSDEYLLLAESDQVKTGLEDIMYRMGEIETNVHSYFITGDKSYLSTLGDTRSAMERQFDKLDQNILKDNILVQYDSLKTAVRLHLNTMDTLALQYQEGADLNQEQQAALKSAGERIKQIRALNQSMLSGLRPQGSNRFLTSRTFTPLVIIIGFLIAIGAIIYLYANLYRSLQANLAAEIELEENLIDLGQEIQERIEAEELVTRILDSSKSSIILYRPIYHAGDVVDFKLIMCNHQTEIQTGRKKEALEGGRLLELFPGVKETGIFDKFLTAVREQKEFQSEILYDMDGLDLKAEIRANPVEEGLVVTTTDISERINAQREIARNHQKFSTLFHQSFQFIALLNSHGEVTDINDSFIEFIRKDREELIGHKLTDLSIWPEEMHDLLRTMITRSLSEGNSRQEALVTRPDGEEIYLDLSCTLVPDKSGDMIIFEARDLTELHWAQEENEFLAHLNVSITHAENFNEAAKTVFNKIGRRYELESTEVWVPAGQGRLRLLSQYLFDPASGHIDEEHPAILSVNEGVVGNVIEAKQMAYIPSISDSSETKLRKQQLLAKGYSSLLAVPIVFEGEVLLVAVFLAYNEIEDVEELRSTLQIMSSSLGALLIKKKVQDDLHRNNLILNEAEKVTRLGSWEWHLKDNSITWSDGLLRIVGKGKDFEPSLEKYFELIHPDERERVKEELMQKVEAKSSYEMDYRLIADDGTIKYVRATGHPMSNNFGQVHAYTGTLQDITRQKEYEIELHNKNEALQNSNKNLEQFAYVASHDLQEPLRKVRAFGGRLENKYDHVLDEKGIDYLRRMQNAAERMQVLINDLLKYSRIARNLNPFRPVDLNEVVLGVVNDLEARIKERGAVVRVEDLPELNGDEVQMRQLFQNLISNAIKFVPTGRTPEVNIWAEPVKYTNGDNNQRYVQISVKDNGIGIEGKFKERIFGLFERLHGRNDYEGTGIGLAICQRVVQNHRGEIKLQSEVDRGTCFQVILPVKAKRNKKPQ